MNSAIFIGHMMHARFQPVKHVFRYPVYVYGIDLDELDALDRSVPLFGYNRFRPVSLYDSDYLDGKRKPLRDRVIEALRDHGCSSEIARIVLVTAARFFNYVFNPVSFYYCFRPDGGLAGTIAEVNNTFGERHLYVLTEPRQAYDDTLVRYTVPKDFHVSPFNDMKGDYDFHFSDIRKTLDIRINILRDGEVAFRSYIKGTPVPLTTGNLLRTIVRYPIAASLTMPRILWQAAKLHYAKGLAVYTKPNPSSAMTIKAAPPSWLDRLAARFVRRVFESIRTGRLLVELPDRTAWEFGEEDSSRTSVIRVRNHGFFWKVAARGDIGFGEAFVAGDWDSPDLTGLFEHLIDNFHLTRERSLLARTAGRLATELRTFARRNTLLGSRQNIEAHYDLGNEFFRTFLDPSMMYSSGVYETPGDSLEQAQQNKIRRLIERARIQPQDHVLEIGSGWGEFAIQAVRQTGCRVTTVTLSREQYTEVRRRIHEEDLGDRIDVQIRDYRDLDGQFDKIVSIEMLEAVGHENYGAFFAVCDRVLKPEGLAVLQVITIPDQRYNSYRRHGDFIEAHVFPGSLCPSLTALSQAMTKSSAFVIESLENIGPDYGRTLKEWRERFLARRHDVRRLGFDDAFLRKWEYYLAYCEAGFNKRILNDLHLVLTRPNNPAL